MIDKETWKIGTDRDKMEKLIKYKCMNNTWSFLLKKKKLSSNRKIIRSFFLWIISRPNWEIQMDFENDV